MNDTKDKSKTGKPQKFLFDAHCFDDDYVEEVIPEEPPPPTFSEEELASAKRESREHGRREALAEAQASREKHIADLLGVINTSFQMLFEAEAQREAQYEAEVLIVVKAIFEKLFPALNERHGLDELETIITGTLEANRDVGEIIMEINPDYVMAIDERLEAIKAKLHITGKITVRDAPDLGPGDCRMRWQDGGANRDVTGLTKEIHRRLEQLLADKASLQDNRTDIQMPEDGLSGPDGDPVTNGDDA